LLATAFLQMGTASADTGTNSLLDLFGFGGTGTTGTPTDPFAGFLDGFGGTAPADSGTLADFDLATIAGSPETILTQSGLPPLDQQVEGTQVLDFFGPGAAADATPLGTVDTDVSTLTTPIGFTNAEYTVTGFDPTTAAHALASSGTPVPVVDDPTVGSTYDVASFYGFSNDYSSIVTPAADGASATTTVTDIFNTPFGSFDVTPFIGGFDASSDYLSPTTGLVDTPFASLLDLGTALGSDNPVLDATSLLGVFPADLANEIPTLLGMF
jgi:hypothetical protein